MFVKRYQTVFWKHYFCAQAQQRLNRGLGPQRNMVQVSVRRKIPLVVQ